MKNILTQFNKAFENRVRLGAMSILMVNDFANFNTLKELLDVTDGNLASHLKALEKLKYINMKKEFIGRKPNTRYSVSGAGKKAFVAHINALENLIKTK